MNRTPVEDAVAGALGALDAPPAAPDLFVTVQNAVRRRARRRAAAAAGALAVVVAAGPVALDGVRGSGPEPAVTQGAVQVLRAGSSSGSQGRYWSTLRGVLPNVTYSYDSAGRQMWEQVTDSVVVGRVVRTEAARGMLGEPLVAGQDVRTRVVAFDDPRAAWRVLTVTVQVSETLAGAPAEQVVLDWTLLGSTDRGQDARAVGQALEDLGNLVVLSKASPNGPEFVPGRSALPSGYGIGRLAAGGGLDFPIIVPQERPSAIAFQDGVDTLAELRDEAQKPAQIENVVPEQGQ